MSVLVSCEVGGDRVPTELVAPTAKLRDGRIALPSNQTRHRKKKSRTKLLPGKLPAELSYDAAARYVARQMAQRLYAPLIANEYSLELIDVTRSLHHRQLYPLLTRTWPAADRERLIEQIHVPYRQRVKQGVEKLLDHFSYVVHLSIRSFDLRHNGKYRRADMGLLYDPSEQDEVDLCLDWIDEMYEEIPMLRVRRNYPRRGTTDSITKAMRSEFADQNYIGIELQFNRAWAGRPVAIRDEVIDRICKTLQTLTSIPQSEAA